MGVYLRRKKDKTNKKEVWRTGLTWHFVYDGKETGARCVHTWGDKDLYNHRLNFLEGKTIVTNSLGHDTTYYHKNGLVYNQEGELI